MYQLRKSWTASCEGNVARVRRVVRLSSTELCVRVCVTDLVGVVVDVGGDVVVAAELEVLGVGEHVLVDVHEQVEDLLLLVQEFHVGGLGVVARVGLMGSRHRHEEGEDDAVAHHACCALFSLRSDANFSTADEGRLMLHRPRLPAFISPKSPTGARLARCALATPDLCKQTIIIYKHSSGPLIESVENEN